MNKTLVKTLGAILVGSFLMVGNALATPVYTGDSSTDWGANGDDRPTGYYIWSNDDLKTSWSVRWTGNNDGGDKFVGDWMGSVEFLGNELAGTGVGDGIDLVSWNNNDGPVDYTNNFFGEKFTFAARAGGGFDGFDFTLETDILGTLRFNLGGEFYTALGLNGTDDGVVAQSLWIGGNNPMVNVDVFGDGETKYQRFETPAPVPEPTTMVLFGTGLIGLAGLARRKKK